MRPVLRVSSLAVLLLALTAIACYDAVGLAPTELHPVAVVTIQPAQASVNIGKTISFSAVALDASGNPVAGEQVTWKSQDTSIASVSTAGAVTPKQPGATVIMASTTDKTAEAALTVLPAPVAAVKLSSASAIITVDDTVLLAATMRDDAGNTLEGRKVGWASADTTIAKVSASGRVKGIAKGHTHITATSEGVSDTTGVTVVLTPPSVASVSVAPTTKSLVPGATVQLSATAKDTSGSTLSGHAVTWNSWSAAIATVSASGLVKAVAVGSATISATVDGKTGTAAITVALIPVATISVSPTSASLSIGGTQQLASTVKDGAGNTLTGRTVAWTTSDTSVATVTTSGLVTAVAAGSAAVTASIEGKTATASITVTDPSPPPPTGTGTHAGWYVSPSGSANGDGSAARPWDLVTALAGPGKVQPGDTIWLRGGTYKGRFTSVLSGTAGAPIIVRQYPEDRATIDGSMLINGSNTWYWGFEIANTNTSTQDVIGVSVAGPGNKFINLISHDHSGNGFFLAISGPDNEVYGSIIYNNGFHGSTSVSHGHGIYAQNRTGTKRLVDNIIFDQFGYGIHIYGSSAAALANFTVDGNISFNNGIPAGKAQPNLYLGGGALVQNAVVTNNLTFTNSPTSGSIVFDNGSTGGASATVENNYFVGGAPVLTMDNFAAFTFSGNVLVGPGLNGTMVHEDGSTGGFTWTGNAFYGDASTEEWIWSGGGYTFASWRSATGLGSSDSYGSTQPSGVKVVVRPNQYEAGRANVAVYNWSGAASVSVDLTKVLRLGDHYEVRNAQDFFGEPVGDGIFNGSTVQLPLSAVAPATPIGGWQGGPPSTGTRFRAFVVLRVDN